MRVVKIILGIVGALLLLVLLTPILIMSVNVLTGIMGVCGVIVIATTIIIIVYDQLMR